MIPYNCFNYDNSKVTLELRDLVESGVKIWDFDYPSYYQGEDKIAFEQKVIDHFLFRQIGMETPGRWLHYFRTRIREIMPYYLQIYESVELMKNVGDPFEAYNLKEEFTRTHNTKGTTQGSRQNDTEMDGTYSNTMNTSRTGEQNTDTDTDTNGTLTGSATKTLDGTHNTENDSETVRKHSDTPQGSIDNIESYMTDATKENGNTSETVTDDVTETTSESKTETQTVNTTASTETTETANTEGSGTNHDTHKATETTDTTTEDEGSESYTLTRRGNIGVQPLGAEIKVYREALINVDMMIIHELNDLFLKVY